MMVSVRSSLLLMLPLVAVLLAAPLAAMPDNKPISIIPRPVHISAKEGSFQLAANTLIVTDRASSAEAHLLSHLLSPATGFYLEVRTTGPANASIIEFKTDGTLKNLGDEGYRLTVAPRRVTLRAAKPAGLFYAVQTLRQLLPVEILREAKVPNVVWTIPSIQIEDYPRFQWRGSMLDSCRHFMPKEFVKKYIDLLAFHKMNSFHWHLTDDQGWRIEIKKYPKLTQIGAWRKETLVGRLRDEPRENLKYDGKPHGGFYTQEDIREIVEYASSRHVNVVPEIEMPGHAQAAIASYPELGNLQEVLPVFTRWGVNENIFNPKETTILFLQDVLAEVLDLFPSKFIHVGGDEAVKAQWKTSPDAQARIKELGLKNEEELQSYFIRHMDKFLTAKGRRLVGWDEILEGGLAPNATVMSWRGEKGGIEAAKSGHDVVMSPTDYTYFDYYSTKEIDKEPLAIGGYLPLEVVYNYEPVPKELPEESIKHILGSQGQIWTEYIPNPKQAEYMAFPRLTALAEVTWTPREQKDYNSFLERLRMHLKRLYILDVNYRTPEGLR